MYNAYVSLNFILVFDFVETPKGHGQKAGYNIKFMAQKFEELFS